MNMLFRLNIVLAAMMLIGCHQSTSQSAVASAVEQAASMPSSLGSLHGVDVRQDQIGGDFTLTAGDGKAFALSSLRGKVVILSFGFTNCPDVCPTQLFTHREAIKQLGEQAKEVAVVFVSVDWERDTPDLVGRYVRQFHRDFIGLTDVEQGLSLAKVKQQYRVVSAKTEIKSDTLYNIDHTSGAYLIDKNGQVAIFAPYGLDSTQVAADVKTLLMQ